MKINLDLKKFKKKHLFYTLLGYHTLINACINSKKNIIKLFFTNRNSHIIHFQVPKGTSIVTIIINKEKILDAKHYFFFHPTNNDSKII